MLLDERVQDVLNRVRVVLVDAKFSGNLGFVARAMRNMGFSDLRLVSPRAELNKEAYSRAIEGSKILDEAKIHARLERAVSDCGIVIGTSRRHGVRRRNVMDPRSMAGLLRPLLDVNKAALVFGSEDSGLSNDDLALCHWVAAIHPGTDYESMNLGHAVAIMLWEINQAALGPRAASRKLASSKDQENMYRHIEQMLLETGFIHEKDPKRMMTVIRQMLHRSRLSERDVRIIRGVLRQIKWRIDNPDADIDHALVKKRRRGK